jgi:hypothetical protein
MGNTDLTPALHIKPPLTPPYPRRGTNTNSQYILTLNPSPKERDFEQPPHPDAFISNHP